MEVIKSENAGLFRRCANDHGDVGTRGLTILTHEIFIRILCEVQEVQLFFWVRVPSGGWTDELPCCVMWRPPHCCMRFFGNMI